VLFSGAEGAVLNCTLSFDDAEWAEELGKHPTMFTVGVEMCSGPLVRLSRGSEAGETVVTMDSQQGCYREGFKVGSESEMEEYCTLYQWQPKAERINYGQLTLIDQSTLPDTDTVEPVQVDWPQRPMFTARLPAGSAQDAVSHVRFSGNLRYERASLNHNPVDAGINPDALAMGGTLQELKCDADGVHLKWDSKAAMVNGDNVGMCGDASSTSKCTYQIWYASEAEVKDRMLYPNNICSVVNNFHRIANTEHGQSEFQSGNVRWMGDAPAGRYVVAVVVLLGEDEAVVSTPSDQLCVFDYQGKGSEDVTLESVPELPHEETEVERLKRLHEAHQKEGKVVLIATVVPLVIVLLAVCGLCYVRQTRLTGEAMFDYQQAQMRAQEKGPSSSSGGGDASEAVEMQVQ
jgi:hypothetical protein